ncbi:uncharacterized protein [Ptychodera flava]|uniref:uncharacterized protein isoform X2 n=1 Tax=Ptychodera flava TaxID=63121 RepID=UPI003969F8B2
MQLCVQCFKSRNNDHKLIELCMYTNCVFDFTFFIYLLLQGYDGQVCLFVRVVSEVDECLPDQYFYNGKCCTRCEAGYKVELHCTATRDTECAKCGEGYFNPGPSGLKRCFLLNHCDKRNEYIYRESDGITDNECRCKTGYHYNSEYTKSMCLQNPICPPGYGIQKVTGKCEFCREGTYSGNSSRTEQCADQPNCEAMGLKVLKAGNSTMATVCYHPTEVQSGSGGDIVIDDGNEDLEVESSSDDGMTAGSIAAICISCIVIVCIVSIVMYCNWKRIIGRLRCQSGLPDDPEAPVGGGNRERSDVYHSLNNVSSISGNDMGNTVQDFVESTETLPPLNGISSDEVTEHSSGGDSVGMNDRHRNLIRQQRPHLVKDLNTRAMLDSMAEVFTEEDESAIMNKSLSEYEQRRKFLDILCTKGPNAYPHFVQVLKVITPHRASPFENEQL